MTRFNRLIWNTVSQLHKRKIRGPARLYSIVAKSFNCEPLLVTKSAHGVSYCLTPRHYIDSEIMRHGYYEPEVLDAILASLKPSEVFWDIGANFGLHSISVAHLRPDSRVVAFEPNPAMLRRIQRNASINRVSLSVVPGGMWDRSTVMSFCDVNDVNPGMAFLDSPKPNRNELCILCHTGDDYVHKFGLPTPNVIKIDTEGAESKVLAGLSGILEQADLHTVIFEEWDTEASSGESVRELLERRGFSVTRLKEGGANHCNWIARR